MKKSPKKINRIGILTSGGDCPGINAVIRAIVRRVVLEYGAEVIGFEDGYHGLIYNRHRRIVLSDVSNILMQGGTILGTSKQANPYQYALKDKGKLVFKDMSRPTIQNIKGLDLDCIICIGGDGSLGIAHKLNRDGIPMVGIPKTIDNDIYGTDITFGFDSAVTVATEGIDRVHTTAESHHRIMIVEVMGHNAGWLGLYSGLAGGADIILIPEIPYQISKVAGIIKERHHRGKKFSIIVVSEGAKPKGGKIVIRKLVKESSDPIRLGGVSFVLAEQLEKMTGLESRPVILGHVQRGGTPTAFDRVLATELGIKAVDMIAHKRFGKMVGVCGGDLKEINFNDVARGSKQVPLDHKLIKSARCVGTSLGD
jgi:phosphofructokinase-like protein